MGIHLEGPGARLGIHGRPSLLRLWWLPRQGAQGREHRIERGQGMGLGAGQGAQAQERELLLEEAQVFLAERQIVDEVLGARPVLEA